MECDKNSEIKPTDIYCAYCADENCPKRKELLEMGMLVKADKSISQIFELIPSGVV